MGHQTHLQHILIRPVDTTSRTVLFSEIKIENIDATFRTVRDPAGLKYSLYPGVYRIKIMLPSLRLKIIPLTVQEGTELYDVSVEEGRTLAHEPRTAVTEALITAVAASSDAAIPPALPHRNPRFEISLPVSYRVGTGNWISTRSVNISNTGVCVIMAAQGVTEDNVHVRLFLPVSSVPIECPARVCWVSENMGLQLFLTENMKSSLNNWLKKASGG